jgi:hypothetical protein
MLRKGLYSLKSITIGRTQKDTRMTKAAVWFPEAFIAEIDRIAQQEQCSRSELLQKALAVYNRMRRSTTRPGDDPDVQAAVAIQDALSHKSPGTGQDSTIDIRRWRKAH